MKKLNILEAGETYRFAGHDWTVCEFVNDGRTAVIQSHGVTHGAWPGFVMPQFANGNYYSKSIDGEDISAYDDKMQALYDAIKDVEDTSASYGKGLYLIPKEKAGFTKCEEPGSGNYWKALKAAAENASSFGSTGYGAWLGTADGSGALYVSSYAASNGYVYSNYGLDNDFVVAPAFNLDLSKVEIVGDEIIIRENSNTSQPGNQSNPAPYRSIWEYGLDIIGGDGKTIHLGPDMLSQVLTAFYEDIGRRSVASYTKRQFTAEQYINVCRAVSGYMKSHSEIEYQILEGVLGTGFEKEENWVVKTMSTADGKSWIMEHPETFSSEQEAWNRVKLLALADQDDKEVAEVRYDKDACEVTVIYPDRTSCKFSAEKADNPKTLSLGGNTEEKQKATLELEKTYRFAGYSWTVCELVNNGRTAVIQSHGVTHGTWPGFVMPQFANGNYYSKSIDGDDISAYDDKMQALYDAIKDVEDTSASYGKGLYLIPKEKAGFTEWGKSGSGNYWAALKALAENARSFGAASDHAWLGTVSGGGSAWCVGSGGDVYDYGGQSYDYVVAPAFNLDLSKVEIKGDEIVIRKSVKNARNTKKEKIREFLDEIYKESEILPENFGDEIVAELEERFLEDGYEITKKNAIEEMLWCYMCKMQ
ncbi:MAG: hypothetical protein SPL82_16130 [Lachnospiraceae bacterium]|nr:hypothetical protein [Lachnospiraceae bacterium]